jgi:hypothetical protein
LRKELAARIRGMQARQAANDFQSLPQHHHFRTTVTAQCA